MKKTKLNPRHLYAIFAFLLSAVVVFCGVQIWQEYSSRQKDIDTFAELSELAEIKEPDEPKETAEPDTAGDAENSDTDSDTQEEQENPVLTPHHDIPLLISQNSDCIGWITIDNTAVDYPVMHTPEWPQKYLRMNFYQQYSDSGVPFLDYRCTLESDNLIIFGHNMRNGTMFSLIRIFLVRSSFCDDLRIRATVMPHIHLGKRSSTESFSCRTSPRQFDCLPTLLKKDFRPESIRWESSSIVAKLFRRTLPVHWITWNELPRRRIPMPHILSERSDSPKRRERMSSGRSVTLRLPRRMETTMRNTNSENSISMAKRSRRITKRPSPI